MIAAVGAEPQLRVWRKSSGLIRPEDFLHTLSWGSAPTAAIILEAGLTVEAERGKGWNPDGHSG